ncbi:apicomplexan CP 15 60K like [Cryptosporidium bovis]|uniref:apicomplexan CP 15 60K like n=1 Tax=Cryptosporidium bovis TaxID=310047 RepID=UPI00351A398F|nr:apicomplexan CP 15 60K like [Cryptosporidium bovis]
MIDYLLDFLHICCEFKKGSNDEYIFAFCPVPSDLDDQESDLEGTAVRKYNKIEGTSTRLINDGVLRHWKGREIGSCCCCHLIYEDENIFEKVDMNGDYDNYIRNSMLKRHIEKNKNKKTTFDQKSCSSSKSAQESSNDTNADLSDSSCGNKEKSHKKGKIKKTPSQIERELDIIEEKRYKNEVLKNKDKKKIPEGENDEDKNEQPGDTELQAKKEEEKAVLVKTSENNRSKFSKSVTNEIKKLSKSISKPGKRAKPPPKKGEFIESGNKNFMHEGSLLKNHSKKFSEKVEQTNVGILKSKASLKKINKGLSSKSRMSSQLEEIDNIQSNVVSSEVISRNNSLVEYSDLTEVEGNNENELNSSKGDCITSDSGYIERQFEEEEVNFTRDIPTRIMKKKSITHMKASIILKDGVFLECELVFSAEEEDLSFVCDGKIKAVPWKNIKEVFTTKEKLKLVNTKTLLSKDHTLVVALQLMDTGNCIPLKFSSREDRREFIEFSKSVL